MLQQTPNNLDIKSTTDEYLKHNGQHDRFIINITSNQSHFEVKNRLIYRITNMGFKHFITNGRNRLKSGVHQGLIGTKNLAHHAWNATKKGLIGANNFAVNNPKAIGTILHAITPFATAFNPALGAITSAGASIFNNMPKGTIKDKLEKQTSTPTIGGSTTAQTAVDSRRVTQRKSNKWVPFHGV